EESIRSIDGIHVQAELVAEVLLNFQELAFAEHAVVDEDASEPIADRARDQGRRNRGIDSAGERTDHASIRTNRVLDVCHRLVDESLRCPVRLCTTDAEDKVLQHLATQLGVVHFWVELNRVIPLAFILDASDSVWRLRR